MLCTVLAAIAWYSLMIYLMVSGEVRNYPNLYNKGNPLYYLFAPCSYLYLRLSLSGNNHLKRYDWLHFTPAIIALVDIVPYMLKSAEEKQYIVNLVAQDTKWNFQYKYAFITQAGHNIIRSIQQIIYIIFQWYLLVKYRRNRINSNQRNWLFTYNIMVTALTLVVIIVLARSLLYSASALKEGMLPIFASIGIFIFCILLFFKPEQLYGLDLAAGSSMPYQPVLSTGRIPAGLDISDEEKGNNKELKLSPEQIAIYTKKLERKLVVNECFKEKGITAPVLAVKLNIPNRHLSVLLKQYYQLKFNDFINGYRVNFVKDQIKKGEWRNLTIEALAEDAGFSSRSTFYAAFKKNTGLTPAEYIARNVGKTV
ncbi:AraC family transcriptional regulator [Pedobacter sp. BS3]|uniref:helix-turn-helix domain-containing protein n=1 Tax=Pedobacter sp. BS3 TaxID=2567937 RepID=UPI0011EE2C87|nr:helix-turn-helix domain-containing protein [Pedobacter sp. BS3]TZF84468.1 AraC family transcriptional regulator [Pedobacter sp. BS3]